MVPFKRHYDEEETVKRNTILDSSLVPPVSTSVWTDGHAVAFDNLRNQGVTLESQKPDKRIICKEQLKRKGEALKQPIVKEMIECIDLFNVPNLINKDELEKERRWTKAKQLSKRWQLWLLPGEASSS